MSTAKKEGATDVNVTVKTAKEPAKGLKADAKAAKELYGAEDKRIAESHRELREGGKIVPPGELLGYDTVREGMYQDKDDRVQPEAPKAVEPTPNPSDVVDAH